MAMNSVSSDVPSTISGVDMGRNTSRLVDAPAPERVTHQGERHEHPDGGRDEGGQHAMRRLANTASPSPGRPSGLSQASMEKPCQVRLARPAGSLKLNAIMTSTGSARKVTARKAYTGSIQRDTPRRKRRHNVPGGRVLVSWVAPSALFSNPSGEGR